MASIPKRALFGFFAAVASVLLFHQGVWALLHHLDLPGLGMPPPYPDDPIAPFGIPRILNLCFWAGLWGAVFAVFWRGPKGSYWVGGIGLGVAAVLVGYFIVAPIKGMPAGGGGSMANWFRSLAINGTWGLGVGILLSYLPGMSEDPDIP